MSVQSDLLAASVDQYIWVAPVKCRVISIKEVHSVAGGASAAVRPRKITADVTAPGAAAGATVIELTTANIDLTVTANTMQTPTLSATEADLIFAAGDRLALDFSGTLTALVGRLTVNFAAMP